MEETSSPQPSLGQSAFVDTEEVYSKGLRVAVMGCGHGNLDQTYATIEQACKINNFTVDLLIISGDFEALRNSRDLLTMAVPQKYRHMGDFYKYYNGSKVAPIPTICVGGNHEASSHFWELYQGGWVCPNIYFMGQTGVINVNGIRIAGVSGIYNQKDYKRPRYERLPYNDGSMRSIYHYRAHELFKMNHISGDLDVFVSHDWPHDITSYGDQKTLLRIKPHFRADIERGELGSPPFTDLLKKLRPRYWFAGHMHVKFTALVEHESQPLAQSTSSEAAPTQNTDEIDLDMEDEDPPATEAQQPATTSSDTYPLPQTTNSATSFIALDKLLPRRDFLQILTIPSKTPLPISSPDRLRFHYDPEWLAITRVFDPKFPTNGELLSQFQKFGSNVEKIKKLIRQELAWVHQNIPEEKLVIPENWVKTAEPQFDDSTFADGQPGAYNNPQTEEFCKIIGIENKWGS